MSKTPAAPAEASAPTRNPAEPIGTPPGGGSWRWDIEAQAWAPAADPTPIPE